MENCFNLILSYFICRMRLWFSESNYVSDLSAHTVYIVLHKRERSVFACNLMAAFIAVLYFRDLCCPARKKNTHPRS